MSITIQVDEDLLREAEVATGIGAREELVSLALKKLATFEPMRDRPSAASATLRGLGSRTPSASA